jgi:hypothetical protein
MKREGKKTLRLGKSSSDGSEGRGGDGDVAGPTVPASSALSVAHVSAASQVRDYGEADGLSGVDRSSGIGGAGRQTCRWLCAQWRRAATGVARARQGPWSAPPPPQTMTVRRAADEHIWGRRGLTPPLGRDDAA